MSTPLSLTWVAPRSSNFRFRLLSEYNFLNAESKWKLKKLYEDIVYKLTWAWFFIWLISNISRPYTGLGASRWLHFRKYYFFFVFFIFLKIYNFDTVMIDLVIFYKLLFYFLPIFLIFRNWMIFLFKIRNKRELDLTLMVIRKKRIKMSCLNFHYKFENFEPFLYRPCHFQNFPARK